MKKALFTILLSLGLFSLASNGQAGKARPEALQSWLDARFGMFVHWGPVSFTELEISWSRANTNPKCPNNGPTSAEVYDNLYKKFNPVEFNADEWVSIAKAAGMKYIILTAKHCDGFLLWDSKVDDYNIMHTPFKRDVCGELAKAAHQAGMKIGWYYSPMDWRDPDCRNEKNAEFVKRMQAEIAELLTNYGKIDILWFDTDGKEAPWESCMTVSKRSQWSWGGHSDGVKPAGRCLDMLIRCAGGDGNMLLNVGPMPSGKIAPEQVEVITTIGDWLSHYGKTIYGTRGGPWKPGKAGVSTYRDKTIYLHILNRPGNTIELPAIGARIVRSQAVTGGKIRVNQTADKITISLPPAAMHGNDIIIALVLDRSAGEIEPLSMDL